MTAGLARIPAGRPRGPAYRRAALAVGPTVVAVAVAWAVVIDPRLAILLAAALAGLALVVDGRARILFVVLGGFLILQSSEEFTPLKGLYMAGMIAALAATVLRFPLLRRTQAFQLFAPLLVSSVAWTVIIGLSFVVAHTNGVPTTAWLRDAAPYVLFATAPLFALDLHTWFSERGTRRLFLVAGLAGTVAFAVYWAQRRAVVELPVLKVGLPSFLLGASLVTYALARSLQAAKQYFRWAALAGVALALMFATGTRATLVLMAAPLAIVLGSRRDTTRRAVRLALALPLTALVAFGALQAITSTDEVDRDALLERASLVTSATDETDRSYIDRISQTEAAWKVVRANWLLGAGPGTAIEWQDTVGRVHARTTLDTPLVLPAKFGLAGVLTFAFSVAGYVVVIRRLARQEARPSVARLALVGYGAAVAAYSILVVPFDDKGFSAALILLLALAAHENRTARERAHEPGGR